MRKIVATLLAASLAGAAFAADTGKPKAIIHTDAGDITVELYPDKAPKTVENFIGLSKGTKQWQDPRTNEVVTNRPLYDGVKFHRTGKGFMIQGGDPTGTGSGRVGFTIPGEPNDLRFDKPGRIAMANVGGNPSSAGSQFFITDSETPQLNPEAGNGIYVIFGQVVDGMDVVKEISGRPSAPGSMQALRPATIKHIEIVEPGAAAGASAAKATTETATVKSDSATTK